MSHILEAFVPPEEFLRLMAIAEGWLLERENATGIPSMTLRYGITQVKVNIYRYDDLTPEYRDNFITRLDMLSVNPAISARAVW
jgi:hypothetical protein